MKPCSRASSGPRSCTGRGSRGRRSCCNATWTRGSGSRSGGASGGHERRMTVEQSQREDVWAAGDRYEPYVGRWSRMVAQEFLQWLGIPAGIDWLDVGCGTRALTQTTIDHAKPRGVKGVDPSPDFIEYAKSHVTGGRASFEVGDAQSL